MLQVLDHAATAPADLIEDLAPDEPVGDLRRRLDFDLNAAYELLLDLRAGRTTDSALQRAAEQVDEAIATLQRFRRRFDEHTG